MPSVHLIGVHLIGVHLNGVYLDSVYLNEVMRLCWNYRSVWYLLE